MKSTQIAKLGLKDFILFSGFIGLLLGALLGLIYTGGGFIIDCLASLNLISEESTSAPGLSYGTILAFGALLGMPIIFGIIRLAIDLVSAPLFNFIAPSIGGLPFTFEYRA